MPYNCVCVGYMLCLYMHRTGTALVLMDVVLPGKVTEFYNMDSFGKFSSHFHLIYSALILTINRIYGECQSIPRSL